MPDLRTRIEHALGTRYRAALAAIVLFATAADMAVAQTSTQRGRLHLIWDGGDGPERVEYFIQPLGGGPPTRLRVPESLERSGQLFALDRTEVEVTLASFGALRAAGPGTALDEASLVSIRPFAAQVRQGTPQAASIAALDFVTVMCRFADDARTPFLASTPETVHGGTSPGLAYHYREMSRDPALMAGSVVVGWYDLPQPRSAYVFTNGANFFGIAQDCAALAQADVDFSQFKGINIQLNGAMQTRSTPPYDTLSFGGSSTLTLDGVSRTFGVTWLSGLHVSNYVVVHHEVGHALGWPHSSGDYGQEYDSRWDIMSVGYLRHQLPWGWQGIHTIAPHKDAVGWLPSERILLPASGAVTKGRLVRSALPPPSGYLMMRVPLLDGGWLSAEARLPAGLDTPLPASAVVMHRVRFGIRSYVVDPDLNNNPNDAAAQWVPGEEFTDAVSGLSIRVDSAVADGFDITVTRGWKVDAAIVGPGEIEVTAPGGSPVRCETDCTNLVTQVGGLFTLNAFPDPGRAFLGWSGACTGTGTCSIVVTQNATVRADFAGQPTITSSSLAPTLMGATYSDSLKVVNDGAPGAWSVATGALPPGLGISASTGRITGIASAAGEFAFTLRVSAGPLFSEQAASIVVTKPELDATAVVDALLGGPSLGVTPQRFLDLLGNRNGRVDVGDVRAWLLDSAELSPAERAALLAALPRQGRRP